MTNGLTSFRLLRKVLLPLLLFVLSLVSLVCLQGGADSRVNAAGDSNSLNFQARLLTSAGAIVPDGNYNIDFKLYSAATGGVQSVGTCSSTCLWEESYVYSGYSGAHAANPGPQLTVKDGYVSVYLGSYNSFPTTINWDQPLWLSMNIDSNGTTNSGSITWDGEMGAGSSGGARIQLTALPYAFVASQLAYTDGSNNRGVLEFNGVTSNQTIYLPNASGTVCLDSATACGFAPTSGGTGYIQLQSSTPGTTQTGDFDISGTGIAGIFSASSLAIQPTSGVVGGVFKAAASGTADLLDIDNSSGSTTVDCFSCNNGTSSRLGGELYLGTSSGSPPVAGTLAFYSGYASSAGNAVTITTSTSAATSSYTLVLPTSTPASNLCLQTGTVSGGNAPLVFASCANTNASISEVSEASTDTSATSLSVSPATTGDLMVLMVDSGNITSDATGVSGGGVTSWTKVVDKNGSDAHTNRVEMWMGTITTTGSTTISVSWTGGTPSSGYELAATEFTAAGVTANTTWGVDTSGSTLYTTGSTSTVTWPSLTSEGNAELYVGYAEASTDPIAAGSTSGFTYKQTNSVGGSGLGNMIAYATPTVASQAYQPTATASGSCSPTTTCEYNSVSTLFTAFVSSTAINNSTTLQQANFYVQAATSGSVAGVLQANGSGDILDLRNSSGTNIVDSFNATGAALIDPSASTYTAFQVQDTSSANDVLTVDTNDTSGTYDDRVIIGNYDANSGSSLVSQLYVGGNIPTSYVGQIATGTNPQGVFVQGNYAYVVNYNSETLTTYDISNPTSPVALGSQSTNMSGTTEHPTSVYVEGSYAYVVGYNSSGGGQVLIFNISNPDYTSCSTAPCYVGITSLSSYVPQSLYVQGKYLYLTASITTTLYLFVFDISAPTAPAQVNFTSIGSGTLSSNSLYVQGTYAYILNESGDYLYIYNIANGGLASSGSISLGTGSGSPSSPYSVYVQGRYAYIAFEGSNNLGIYDVSNPAVTCTVTCNPVGSVATGTAPYDVYVQGRYAYVANEGSSTLGVYDVSTPSSPVSISTPVTTGSSPYSVYVEGRYAYVVDESASELQIFDLGGSYIQQLQTGGILTGTLQTEGNAIINGDLQVSGGLTIAQGVGLQGNLGINGVLTAAGPALFQDASNSSTALQVDNNAGSSILTVDTQFKDVLISAATQGSANYCNGSGEDTISVNGVCLSQDGINLEGAARAEETVNLLPIYSGSYTAAGSAGTPSVCTGGTGTLSNGYDTTEGTNYYKWTSTTANQCENIFLTVPVPQDFSTWDSATPFNILAKSSTTSANTVSIQVFETSGTQLGSIDSIGPGSSANTWQTRTTASGTIGFTTGVSASQNDFVPGQFFTVEVTLDNSAASSTVEIGDLTMNYFRWY